jgi:gluconokinase
MILILAGVSGVGKTTVGKVLAERLGCRFLDADELHSNENRNKMRAGIALTDADRTEWLAAVRASIEELSAENLSAIVACSALKKAYRDFLAGGTNVRIVILNADFETVRQRMTSRQGHFMPVELLVSQYETLQMESDDLVIDAAQDSVAVAAAIEQMLDEEGFEAAKKL